MFNLLEIENGESAPFYHQQIMFISATMVMVINMILTITDLLAGRGSRSNWQQQQLTCAALTLDRTTHRLNHHHRHHRHHLHYH